MMPDEAQIVMLIWTKQVQNQVCGMTGLILN